MSQQQSHRTELTPNADKYIPCSAVFFLTTALWACVGNKLYLELRTGMDLSIFDQAIGNLAQGKAPLSSMKSIDMNLWGDHFHPAIILLAPFYWIWNDPRTLLLAQALLIGLASSFLTWTAMRLGFTWKLACLAGASLSLSTGVQNAAVFDFHEIAIGAPLLAAALGAWLLRHERLSLLLLTCFLLVKEDSPIILLGFTVSFLLMRRWLIAIYLATASVAWLIITTKMIIPHFSPSNTWMYSSSVGSIGDILANLKDSLWSPGPLTHVTLILIACAGLIAVRSPFITGALASIAARAITSNPNYMGFGYHYNLLPCVILSFAALDGLQRRRSDSSRMPILHGLNLVIALIYIVSSGPVRGIVQSDVDYTRLHDLAAVGAYIPANAPLATDVYLTSHFTRNHTILQQLRPPEFLDDQGKPVLRNVRWVLIDMSSNGYRNVPGWAPALESKLKAQGWEETHREGDFALLTTGQR